MEEVFGVKEPLQNMYLTTWSHYWLWGNNRPV